MILADISTVRMGYTFRKRPEHQDDGDFLVIQPKDLSSDGMLMTEKICRIRHATEKILKRGDVLLVNRGKFTSAVFDGSIKTPSIATSAFLIITPKDPEQVLPEYLALFFNSTEGQKKLKRLNETTTISFISRANVEKIEITIPTLAQQKKLVEFNRITQRYATLSNKKLNLHKQILQASLITYSKGDIK
ncbi:MAG: restriction endonuclease subunit S [Kiritimatiellae bacterium]|nr:restriction endonuclease subunit S [Kiritimatiellia bacterium]